MDPSGLEEQSGGILGKLFNLLNGNLRRERELDQAFGKSNRKYFYGELGSDPYNCGISRGRLKTDYSDPAGDVKALVESYAFSAEMITGAAVLRGRFTFRGAVRIDSLRAATHADIVKAFQSTGFVPSNHFIGQLKHVRLNNLGVQCFKDVETIFRKGSVFDADDGGLAIVHNGIAIIFDPETKRLITIRPW